MNRVWKVTPRGFRLEGGLPGVEVFLPGHHPEGVRTLRQIHSARVVDVDREMAREGDGLFTASGVAIGVRTADCFPVVLWDLRDPRRYAVLHVGWRGLYRGILERGRAYFPGAVLAAVGPGICGSCYRVGPSFVDWAREGLSHREGGYHLDLERSIRGRLERMGVMVVAHAPACTLEDPSLPSFRRTGVRGASLLTVVWMQP